MSDQQGWAGNPYYPPPKPEPAQLEYHQLSRAGRPGIGWSLLAVVSAVVAFVGAQLLVLMGFLVYFVASGQDVAEGLESLVDTDDLAPRALMFLLLAIAAAIPLIMLAHRLVTGLSPRWLLSVAGRVRWLWLLVSMGLALVALVVNIVLATLLPVDVSGTEDVAANDFTSTSLRFLLVIVLLVPFQAAAEEYVFRGLLMQGCGSLLRSAAAARVVAVVVPALLFAAAHGVGQSFPIFLDRLAFGLVAGVLAIGTGGLEAGIGYHVVNNWLAFGIALFFGDIGAALQPSGGNGWNIVVTLASSVVFLALALGAARLMKVQTRAERTVLERSAQRV